MRTGYRNSQGRGYCQREGGMFDWVSGNVLTPHLGLSLYECCLYNYVLNYTSNVLFCRYISQFKKKKLMA